MRTFQEAFGKHLKKFMTERTQDAYNEVVTNEEYRKCVERLTALMREIMNSLNDKKRLALEYESEVSAAEDLLQKECYITGLLDGLDMAWSYMQTPTPAAQWQIKESIALSLRGGLNDEAEAG